VNVPAAVAREDAARIWRDFCAKLADAGEVFLRTELPASAIVQAEGLRYLSQLLRTGLMQNLEAADPDFPFFFQPSDATTKFGADNPDNDYLITAVRGDRDYRITGKRGTVSYFSIASNAFRAGGMISTGELNDKSMTWGPDGSFEIIASSRQQPGNWLRMEPDSGFLLIRQTKLDHAKEKPGTFQITQIGNTGAPAPLDVQRVESALTRTAGFVRNNANKFVGWVGEFKQNVNLMPDIGLAWFQKQGADTSIRSTWGYLQLKPDEAWVVDFKVPPEASYWSFVLYSPWLQSLDFRYRPVWVNKHSAKLNKDGSVTVVAAARDAGVGNWLDTAGHSEAVALFRGIGIEGVPEFKCRVVKLADLKA
jgi:hypothetical protein